MSRIWELLFDISKGRSWSSMVPFQRLHLTFSAALPDYVFEEGERQPRPVLKRPKKEVRSHYMYCAENISSTNACQGHGSFE